MEKLDYEALGKYVAAKERAQVIVARRNEVFKKISKLAGQFDSSGYGSEFAAAEFDEERLQTLISEARAIDSKLQTCLDEANNNAIKCDKPELNLFTVAKHF